MYKVIKHFVDLQDNNHEYKEGDVFPRPGLNVSVERFAELAGPDNRQRVPLIAKVVDDQAEEPAEVEETKEPGKGKKAKKTAEK